VLAAAFPGLAAGPPAFDRDAIGRLLRYAQACEAGWRDWFAAHSIRPVEIVYKDLIEDVDRAARTVAGFLGVTWPAGLAPVRPRTRRQAGHHTGRLTALFGRHDKPEPRNTPQAPAHRAAAGRFMPWLSDDLPAHRGLAVVWLIRGASASDPESGMPATGPFFWLTVLRSRSYNGTAPIEVSSGGRTIHRLSLRGNRRPGHAIHMAAVTQIRHRGPRPVRQQPPICAPTGA
jgi:hypothetical protein